MTYSGFRPVLAPISFIQQRNYVVTKGEQGVPGAEINATASRSGVRPLDLLPDLPCGKVDVSTSVESSP
ncbi:MAG: hypothetical protein M3434_04275 [Gemmatimonadota bacterium]|nr:hypothetical protein [Gemmatimonadota bacterium]